MPPVAANNGFAPVIGHLNTLKDLLDKMEAKLKGTYTNEPKGNNGNRNAANEGANAAAAKAAANAASAAAAANAAAQGAAEAAGNGGLTNGNNNAARAANAAAEKVKQAAANAAAAAQGAAEAAGNGGLTNGNNNAAHAANAAAEKVKKAAANAAEAAEKAKRNAGTMVVAGPVVKHPVNNNSNLSQKRKNRLSKLNNGPKAKNGLGNNPLTSINVNVLRNNGGLGKTVAARKATMEQIAQPGHMGANSLPASKPGINKVEKNRNAKLKNLTKNIKMSNINGSAKPSLNNNSVHPEASNANKKKLEDFLSNNNANKGGRRSRKHRHTRRRHTRRH